jgi:hypothetical protein
VGGVAVVHKESKKRQRQKHKRQVSGGYQAVKGSNNQSFCRWRTHDLKSQ